MIQSAVRADTLPDRRRLGELLVERGLIRPADIANALSLQAQNGGLIGLNLVRLGALSEAQLLDVLSEQMDLPVLAPENGPAPERISAFLDEIGSPLAWWADREAVAWREEPQDGAGETRILCAAVQPLDPALAERIAQAQSLQASAEPVAFFLAQRSLIEALAEDLTRDHVPALDPALGGAGADAARLRELAQEAPVIDFVNAVFAEALTRRASDVHVEPYEDRFLVRMRIDGVLTTARSAPRSNFDAVCSRIKLLSGMDIGERRRPPVDSRLGSGGRPARLDPAVFLGRIHRPASAGQDKPPAAAVRTGRQRRTGSGLPASGRTSQRRLPDHRPDRLGQDHHHLSPVGPSERRRA